MDGRLPRVGCRPAGGDRRLDTARHVQASVHVRAARDPAAWPKPRELPTLWYARAYTVARLKEIGEGRAPDERGDLYDGIYFQDSAYADILVTEDDGIDRRARSARITDPRIIRLAEWVADITRT